MAYDRPQLPILDVISELRQGLQESNTVILQAPPGAGKSTLLPLELMEESWLQGKKVLMLEPRRLAARSVAHRLSDLLGQKIAQRVGYRVRFDTKVGPRTQIEVVTEGILTRMMQEDNALEQRLPQWRQIEYEQEVVDRAQDEGPEDRADGAAGAAIE